MIYIFEDRYERRENNQSIINKYSDYIQYTKFEITACQDLADFLIDKIEDAECVMLHNSYRFTDMAVNVEEIRRTVTELMGARFVIFSGGIESPNINSQGVIFVNADTLYSNLELFLEQLKKTGTPTYEILIWGQNYQLNKILSSQAKIHFEKFLECNLDEIVDPDDLEDTIDDIETEGLDIADSVKEKFKSMNEKISYYTLCKAIQSEINKQ